MHHGNPMRKPIHRNSGPPCCMAICCFARLAMLCTVLFVSSVGMARETGDVFQVETVIDDAEFSRLVEELGYPEWKVREQAALALGRSGDLRSVEPLIRSLNDSDGRVGDASAKALACLGVVALDPLLQSLKDPSSDVRNRVAEALRQIGVSAVDSLLKALNDLDPNVRGAVVKVLGQLKDSRAVEPLIWALRDKESAVRANAAEALGLIGDGRSVIPLILALSSPEPAVRGRVAGALGLLGDGRAVEPLIRVLEDPDPDVRRAATEALGRTGDSRALNPLLQLFGQNSGEHDSIGRMTAAKALGQLGDVGAAGTLVEALTDNDSAVRREASLALGWLGDERALELLLLGLNDRDELVRKNASEVLSHLGTIAVDPLILKLNEFHPEARVSAIETLASLKDLRAVAPLIALVNDPDLRIVRAAAGALGRLGDSRAVQPLVQLLKDSNRERVIAAAGALGPLGDERSVSPLIELLSHDYPAIREQAVEALVEFGEPVVKPLIDALKHPDRHIREASALALGHLSDVRSVDALINALKDRQPTVRDAASIALKRLGDPVVEPLIAALNDTDSRFQEAAIGCLVGLGKNVVEPLIRELQNPNPGVRESASKALARLPQDDRILEGIIRTSLSWYWGPRATGLRMLAAEARPFRRAFIRDCARVSFSPSSLAYVGAILIVAGGMLHWFRRVFSPTGRWVPGWAGWVSLGSLLVSGLLYGRFLLVGPGGWVLTAISLTPMWIVITVSPLQGAILWPWTWKRVRGYVCLEDFSRFVTKTDTWMYRWTGGALAHEANWDDGLGVTCMCRICGRQKRKLTGIKRVVAILDNRGKQVFEQRDGDLRVNWLVYLKPFDLEAVELVNVTDEEVEAFTNQMRFESDECIASRLLTLDCRVDAGCALKDGTMRLLKLTFGKVWESYSR